MNERERLIELMGITLFGNLCNHCGADNPSEREKVLEITADHLLANGVVVLPCKVGTPVYGVATPCGGCAQYNNLEECRGCTKRKIIEFNFDYDVIGEFGKTVFLTCEEAETELAKYNHD